jgi:hypothetical protein
MCRKTRRRWRAIVIHSTNHRETAPFFGKNFYRRTADNPLENRAASKCAAQALRGDVKTLSEA